MTDPTPTDADREAVARFTVEFDAQKEAIERSTKKKTEMARKEFERCYAAFLVAKAREEMADRLVAAEAYDIRCSELEHPEERCDDCGGPNVVWFAPNELWNRVNADRAKIQCPVCFIQAAERCGIYAVWSVDVHGVADVEAASATPIEGDEELVESIGVAFGLDDGWRSPIRRDFLRDMLANVRAEERAKAKNAEAERDRLRGLLREAVERISAHHSHRFTTGLAGSICRCCAEEEIRSQDLQYGDEIPESVDTTRLFRRIEAALEKPDGVA